MDDEIRSIKSVFGGLLARLMLSNEILKGTEHENVAEVITESYNAIVSLCETVDENTKMMAEIQKEVEELKILAKGLKR